MSDPRDKPGQRTAMVVAAVLLLLSALPDAAVVPVLHGLIIDRYGVDAGAAHLFMGVNLIGAMFAASLVGRLRRRLSVSRLIAIAALLNSGLLLVMSAPIGFAWTLILRTIEGGADVAVYALLFDRISRLGSSDRRGRRMGAAGTVMLLGIAGGLFAGGVVGEITPLATLWVGSAACALVALIGAMAIGVEPPPMGPVRRHGVPRRLWPPLAMMFADRALSSVLATTVPIYFATIAGLGPSLTGALIGISMLATALGAWPAGRLVERTGVPWIRAGAGVLFAGGLLVIPVVTGAAMLITVMLSIGAAGALLFASSLVAIAERSRGPSDMASYHACGNAGFLFGTLTAAAVLSGRGADAATFALVFTGFAAGYVCVGVVAILGLTRPDRPITRSLRELGYKP